MRNETFVCLQCGMNVSKHPEGSARNHCPGCLCSLHVDKNFPGDRASECGGIMFPIKLDHKKKKGTMLIHQCKRCGNISHNKIAPDDNQEVIHTLMHHYYNIPFSSKREKTVKIQNTYQSNIQKTGTLFVIATPIGNLEDITYRAVRILREEVEIIVCEDTRTTGILCQHYDITKPRMSYHAHSGITKIDKILSYLFLGKNVALVSDAGTPGISDPGYPLIHACLEHDISLSPLPGASAFLSCLVVSGFATHHFLYLGFLPVKKGRYTLLTSLKNKSHTVVIYESVHRIKKTLCDLTEIFGADHLICIGREITKKFEEFYRGTLLKAIQWIDTGTKKGEFVLVF